MGLWLWVRRCCSYWRPQVLERRRTSHHPLLRVVEVRGRRRLDGRGVNHSGGGLAAVLAGAFERIELGRVDSLLMLGFGAGSAIEILRRRHALDPRVTAVEIDPEVVELARTWFGYARDERVEFVVADAAQWVREERGAYALVVVDAFIEDRVPRALQTDEFAAAVARCVAPDGWLLFNCMVDDAQRRTDARCVERALYTTLGEVQRLDVQGNRVFAWKRARDR